MLETQVSGCRSGHIPSIWHRAWMSKMPLSIRRCLPFRPFPGTSTWHSVIYAFADFLSPQLECEPSAGPEWVLSKFLLNAVALFITELNSPSRKCIVFRYVNLIHQGAVKSCCPGTNVLSSDFPDFLSDSSALKFLVLSGKLISHNSKFQWGSCPLWPLHTHNGNMQ